MGLTPWHPAPSGLSLELFPVRDRKETETLGVKRGWRIPGTVPRWVTRTLGSWCQAPTSLFKDLTVLRLEEGQVLLMGRQRCLSAPQMLGGLGKEAWF